MKNEKLGCGGCRGFLLRRTELIKRRAATPQFFIFHLSFFILLSCSSEPATEQIPEPVVRTAKLIFIGDVMSHAPQVTAARRADGYDYSEVFRHVRPMFEEADLVVANLETTLRSAPPYTGFPAFAAPAELAFAMREAGVDVATLAGNHICDKGAQGLRSTLAILDSAGMAHTGAFRDSVDRLARNPLRVDVNGLRFALLNYTYGTNGLPVPRGMYVNQIDTVVIAADLASIRRDSVDCVIVSYHWGEEYRSQPTPAQRRLAEWTRARGADIIIGGHPHVVEPFEVHYNADSTAATGATYYSLGNFVSNQRKRYTDGGMAAEITVTKTDSLPVRYDFDYGLTWVHTFWRGGTRRYEVLPTAAADTMKAIDPVRGHYERFVSDSRNLLK